MGIFTMKSKASRLFWKVYKIFTKREPYADITDLEKILIKGIKFIMKILILANHSYMLYRFRKELIEELMKIMMLFLVCLL